MTAVETNYRLKEGKGLAQSFELWTRDEVPTCALEISYHNNVTNPQVSICFHYPLSTSEFLECIENFTSERELKVTRPDRYRLRVGSFNSWVSFEKPLDHQVMADLAEENLLIDTPYGIFAYLVHEAPVGGVTIPRTNSDKPKIIFVCSIQNSDLFLELIKVYFDNENVLDEAYLRLKKARVLAGEEELAEEVAALLLTKIYPRRATWGERNGYAWDYLSMVFIGECFKKGVSPKDYIRPRAYASIEGLEFGDKAIILPQHEIDIKTGKLKQKEQSVYVWIHRSQMSEE